MLWFILILCGVLVIASFLFFRYQFREKEKKLSQALSLDFALLDELLNDYPSSHKQSLREALGVSEETLNKYLAIVEKIKENKFRKYLVVEDFNFFSGTD